MEKKWKIKIKKKSSLEFQINFFFPQKLPIEFKPHEWPQKGFLKIFSSLSKASHESFRLSSPLLVPFVEWIKGGTYGFVKDEIFGYSFGISIPSSSFMGTENKNRSRSDSRSALPHSSTLIGKLTRDRTWTTFPRNQLEFRLIKNWNFVLRCSKCFRELLSHATAANRCALFVDKTTSSWAGPFYCFLSVLTRKW